MEDDPLSPLPEALPLDAETKALESPQDHKNDLRLWLRLLTCTTLVETEIRRRLREQFDVTLPRFDLMAQLERAPQGMPLGEISKRMMVSNGNLTVLVERLVDSGFLQRTPLATDRRVQVIALTKAGRKQFSVMAKAHEAWIAELFGGLSGEDIESLLAQLSKLKQSVTPVIEAQARP